MLLSTHPNRTRLKEERRGIGGLKKEVVAVASALRLCRRSGGKKCHPGDVQTMSKSTTSGTSQAFRCHTTSKFDRSSKSMRQGRLPKTSAQTQSLKNNFCLGLHRGCCHCWSDPWTMCTSMRTALQLASCPGCPSPRNGEASTTTTTVFCCFVYTLPNWCIALVIRLFICLDLAR